LKLWQRKYPKNCSGHARYNKKAETKKVFMAGLPQEPMDSAISIAVFMAEPPQVLMDKGEGFSTCAIFNQYK
jgi:hypothetical protein